MNLSLSLIQRLRKLTMILCPVMCLAGAHVQGRPSNAALRSQASQPASQSVSQDSPVQRLTVGERLEREIIGSSTHRYDVSLKAGQFAAILVDQQAVDLAITVLDRGATLIAEFDGRWQGPVPVFVRSSGDGVYRLEIRTVLKPTVAERYEVTVEALVSNHRAAESP